MLDTVTVTAAKAKDASPGASTVDERKIAGRRAATSDSASLLEDVPGVSLYGAGGISSLPTVHGLADDRLRTQVDGMDLMTACPNHMNSALSDIDPTKVASVTVFAGITPVSAGGDSIGGTIQVKSAPPRFAGAEQGILAKGQAGMHYRSNGNARGNNVGLTLAGRQVNLSYSESNSESDNYLAGGNFKKSGAWQKFGEREDIPQNEVVASEYRGAKNRDIGLALKLQDHLVELNVSEQQVAYEGFPNQRMDMISSVPDPDNPGNFILDKGKPANVNRLVNFHYTGQYQWGELEARLFRQRLTHHMDLLQDRYMGMFMPMDTEATTDGGLLMGSVDLSEKDILRIGGDFQKYRLNDWWPGVGSAPGSMCCNDFWNVRDGKRDRTGFFAEWEADWNPEWLSLLGIRRTTVEADAGPVQGYSTVSSGYKAESDAFNARNRHRTDHHLDLTTLARYMPNALQTYEFGFARKTRSPNLYERYPWSTSTMVALMNNFVGDGNGYIGNPDLEPEVAHTLSATGDWHSADNAVWGLKTTAYLTRVQDYIDAQRCGSVRCGGTPNLTKTTGFVSLQYVNQSARLYGMDISGHRLLGRGGDYGSFTAKGMLSYVRGENRTTGDNLYHIMPLNAKLTLEHSLGSWTNTAELLLVSAKTHVSQVRNEMQTGGYGLFNLRSSYEWKHARFDLGVENVFNRLYSHPLGGAYVGQGNSMTTGVSGPPWGMTVPGRGRSVNAALNLRF